MYRTAAALPVIALFALSACGGGGSGTRTSLDSFATQFANLSSDPQLASFTPDATVDALNSSASYDGIINIGVDDPANPAGQTAYYGNLTATVDFTTSSVNDTLTGSAGGFVQYFSEVASPRTGTGISGSLDLTGALTGSNDTGIGDGLTGNATGTIDGTAVAYTFDGNVTGLSGQGLIFYFDGDNPVSTGGVGIAAR